MNTNNYGFAVINNLVTSMPEKTVLVLGTGRGGTSMMAGVLSKLGVYMGEGLTSRYQDKELLQCLHSKNKQKAKKIIQVRNNQHTVWGIKKLRLWQWDSLFRQPVYVVVFRDVMATANRHILLSQQALVPALCKVFLEQFFLLLFIRLTKRPLFIVSYEKALLNPDKIVAGLTDFLGLDSSQEKQEEAVRFINPSPVEYTRSPVNYRIAQQTREEIGYIDKIEAKLISGWALRVRNKEPVKITLFINGACCQTIIANLSRPDVAATNPDYHERCGFIFNLVDTPLQGGEEIEVRFTGTNQELLNSPWGFITMHNKT